MKKYAYLVFAFMSVATLASCGDNTSDTALSHVPPVEVSTSVETSTQTSTSTKPVSHMDLFKEALEKDYSNMKATVVQSWDRGESGFLDYEYYDDGYIAVYDTYYAELGYSPWVFFHDYEGVSHQWFEKDNGNPNPVDAWLAKGYKNVSLAIQNNYFSMDVLLDYITIDKISYELGYYYVNDAALLETINSEAFAFAWNNPINDLSFTLNDQGYIQYIFGFDLINGKDGEYVQIKLEEFGTTTIPTDLPPKPSEENVMEYWEYKGYDGPYVEVYADSLSIAFTSDVTKEEGFDAVLDIEKTANVGLTILPDNANTYSIEWVSTDEEIVTVDSDFMHSGRFVTGRKAGTAKIYAQTTGANGTIVKSNELTVKVLPVPEQNKENAVYDFTFSTILENKLYATNSVTTTATHDITVNKASLRLGSYSDELWPDNSNVLILEPAKSDFTVSEHKAFVEFDFDDQQVSSISLYYAMFYESNMGNKDRINYAKILTSNDGEQWNEIDILSEVKENISGTNKKLLEKSFEPASIVKIMFGTNTLGVNVNVGINEVAFMANDECHNHGDAPENIPVSQIVISPLDSSVTSLYVDRTMDFVATVLPLNATDKTITWHSSNETVASISASGVLTALSAGTTEVYATSADSSVESNHVTITIKAKEVLPAFYDGLFYGECNELADTVAITLNKAQETLTVKILDATTVLTLDSKDESNYYVFLGEGEDYLRIKQDISFDGRLDVVGTVGNYTFGSQYGATAEFNKYVFTNGISITTSIGAPTSDLSILVGDTVEVTTSVRPSNASEKTITVKSINSEVANFTSGFTYNKGTLVGIAPGVSTIVFETADGVTETLTITVVAVVNVSSITITSAGNATSLDQYATLQLTATINEDANKSQLVWSTSDSSIATVDQTGKVTGVGTGNVTISCKDTYSNVTSQIVLTVNAVSGGATFDASLAGEYYEYDISSYNLTINDDGKTATITNYYTDEVYAFTITSVNGNTYVFTTADGEVISFTYDENDGGFMCNQCTISDITDCEGAFFYAF